MSGMPLNKTCSAKALLPSTFRLFQKDNCCLALETLHLYSIWFDTSARSGERRRRQLLYKSASIHLTFGSLSQLKPSSLQHSKRQPDSSLAININNSQPHPPSQKQTHIPSCCPAATQIASTRTSRQKRINDSSARKTRLQPNKPIWTRSRWKST